VGYGWQEKTIALNSVAVSPRFVTVPVVALTVVKKVCTWPKNCLLPFTIYSEPVGSKASAPVPPVGSGAPLSVLTEVASPVVLLRSRI
jgi:hypothetical protein